MKKFITQIISFEAMLHDNAHRKCHNDMNEVVFIHVILRYSTMIILK